MLYNTSDSAKPAMTQQSTPTPILQCEHGNWERAHQHLIPSHWQTWDLRYFATFPGGIPWCMAELGRGGVSCFPSSLCSFSPRPGEEPPPGLPSALLSDPALSQDVLITRGLDTRWVLSAPPVVGADPAPESRPQRGHC